MKSRRIRRFAGCSRRRYGAVVTRCSADAQVRRQIQEALAGGAVLDAQTGQVLHVDMYAAWVVRLEGDRRLAGAALTGC